MNKKHGCLIIHGFGGNFDEISPLADALETQGYVTACPSLKGHTGKRSDLYNCTYHQWIESAEKSYVELRKNCRNVFLLGFSMGGLIAIHIASRHDVGGVVTMNTPIYVWDINKIMLNIANDIKCRELNNIKGYLRSFVRFPMKSLINFKLLLRDTKDVLPKIQAPLFTAQALNDDTVKLKSVNYLHDNISSEIKERKFYQNSGHLILRSEDSLFVINDIVDFLQMQQIN